MIYHNGIWIHTRIYTNIKEIATLPKPHEGQATAIAQLQEQLQQSKLKMAEQRNHAVPDTEAGAETSH